MTSGEFRTCIAPRPGTFLLTSALDPVEEVLVVRSPITESFVRDAEPIVRQAGARLVTVEAPDLVQADRWIQDTVELGVVVGDGEEPCVAPAALLGLRAKHQGLNAVPLDRHMARYLHDRGIRCFDVGEPRPADDWIDWYGNLEVSPPVTTQEGRRMPFGRALTGRQGERTIHPGVMDFLERQGVQVPPVVIDTSWLRIGHVDEVVGFVPADTRVGFAALVPSPALARKVLGEVNDAGHGDALVFEGTQEQCTVADLLHGSAADEENYAIDRHLAGTEKALCEGLGIGMDSIVRLPALFHEGAALIPNPINSLVCNGHLLIPNPKGPKPDRKDAFATAIDRALSPFPVTPHFVDGWEAFHVACGEIHCGTNAIRRPAYDVTAGIAAP